MQPVPRRWAVLLLPLILLSLALFARHLAAQAYRAFTAYDTPFATEPATGAPAPAPAEAAFPALSDAVVLVLVDGLGLEPSRRLPFVNELRARGADYALRIGLPSLSLPGRAVMMTGAWQEVHGQSTNQHPRPLRVEHVFQLVQRQGRETALAAGQTAQALFTPYVRDVVLYPKEPETAPFATYEASHGRQVASALALLRTPAPAFALIELYVTDEAGHGWGAASPEYGRAAGDADAAIREIASHLDLARTTLIVTADHGHVAAGGHGGPEASVMTVPFVMVGRGVRKGAVGEGAQVDVASTLCALLGVPLPSSNQGRPLLDGLELSASQRTALLRATLDARRAFLVRYTTRLRALDGEALAAEPGSAAPPPAAPREADLVSTLDGVDAAFAALQRRKLGLDAAARWPRGLLFAALPLVAGVLASALVPFRRRDLVAALGLALAGALLYHALLSPFGLHYSLTAVNKDEWTSAFFRKDMILGVAICMLITLAAALLRARSGGRAWDAAGAAWLTAAIFVSLFVVKVAVVYLRYGVFLRWHMPDQYWSFGFYLDALVVMAVGFASPFLGLFGWVAQRAHRGPGTAAVLSVLCCLTFAQVAAAETLAEAAAREAARRQRGEAKAAPVITEGELKRRAAGGTLNLMTGPAEAPSPRPSASPSTAQSRSTPTGAEASADRDTYVRGGRDIGEWSARAGALHDEIRTLTAEVTELEKNPGGMAERTLVCPNGNPQCWNPVRASRSPGQRLARARTRLAAAQQALSDLEDEARRLSVPPGWLRER